MTQIDDVVQFQYRDGQMSPLFSLSNFLVATSEPGDSVITISGGISIMVVVIRFTEKERPLARKRFRSPFRLGKETTAMHAGYKIQTLRVSPRTYVFSRVFTFISRIRGV